jgi:hypothetical protein
MGRRKPPLLIRRKNEDGNLVGPPQEPGVEGGQLSVADPGVCRSIEHLSEAHH